jgi:hypothetical protein
MEVTNEGYDANGFGLRPIIRWHAGIGTRRHQYFQELIGMLRWATEIGRVDILHEISILSQYQASPREGHLEQVLHIFAFLKKKPKLTIYLHHSLPGIDYGEFKTRREDFAEHYRDAEKSRCPMIWGPTSDDNCFRGCVTRSQ